MPEGDTIFKVARNLGRALSGRTVTAITSPHVRILEGARGRQVVGSQIDLIEARGKHLLLHFSSGVVLHTHQLMHGSWHLYKKGSPWRRPRHEMRAVVEVEGLLAVCFLSPIVELVLEGRLGAHESLGSLGPDLLSPAFDVREAVRRLRSRGGTPIGVALLDQRALSGIGNVYKSEVLFLCGLDPFAPVLELPEPALTKLVEEARAQMKRNLGPGRRRTASAMAPFDLFVYERRGKPCRRCATPIESRRQGEMARTTYFCPTCQPSRARGDPRP